MPVALESTRLEWEQGHRRLEAAADDRLRYQRLLGELEVVLVLVFAVGIALGEALEDHPRPGRTTTQERTLTVQPKQRTVTVTTP